MNNPALAVPGVAFLVRLRGEEAGPQVVVGVVMVVGVVRGGARAVIPAPNLALGMRTLFPVTAAACHSTYKHLVCADAGDARWAGFAEPGLVMLGDFSVTCSRFQGPSQRPRTLHMRFYRSGCCRSLELWPESV